MEIGPDEPISTFFCEAFLSAREKCVPLNDYRGACGHLRVINQERVDNRRVVLSVDLCLEA